MPALAEAGCSAVKVGIGWFYLYDAYRDWCRCSARITAVAAVKRLESKAFAVTADGVSVSGDIAKAIAAGASAVLVHADRY